MHRGQIRGLSLEDSSSTVPQLPTTEISNEVAFGLQIDDYNIQMKFENLKRDDAFP